MNLFDIPKEKMPDELFEVLLDEENIRIERIVSKQHTSGWYDQNEDEWLCLLKGEAELDFGTEKKQLLAGETLFIPSHKRHRVSKTTECVWLCVFITKKSHS